MTLRTVLLSLQALLSAAEPDDPQDAVVASQYKDNYEMFALTAKHWTNAYAGGKIIQQILQGASVSQNKMINAPKTSKFENKKSVKEYL